DSGSLHPFPTRRSSDLSAEAVVKGDSRVAAISAASILAKVTRDRELVEFDKLYPGYGLADHKGYPTKVHLDALMRLGVTPIHRRSEEHTSELQSRENLV